jgi:integrase
MAKRRSKSKGKKPSQKRQTIQRKQRAAARKREGELTKIEKLLGEEFSSLAEARRALKSETLPLPPKEVEVTDADEYDRLYQQWDEYDFGFEDQGEIDAGVDY